ncbi:unnamed protein product [Rhizophagus irregularis]|nr:unnamed protein product [Rhizophagus irregularis]
MIIELITGERSYSMAALFNNLSDEKTEHPLAIVEDSVKLVSAIRKYNTRLPWFELVPPFLRHYVPYFKNISDDTIQNVKYLNKRLDAIIKKRRKEIENTPLDKPLPSDMLTSVVTASTPRDFNRVKTIGGEILRPMTDEEISFIMLDGFLAGTDTTANMISFIVYFLAHNPDAKMKIKYEIDLVDMESPLKTTSLGMSVLHRLSVKVKYRN